MIEEKENKNEELEVNLEEVETEKEVNVPLNPLEKLQQQQEEEPSKDEDKSFENERQIKLEKAPAYSDDMPYSVKVRKRIQKEVAKRAEAEQKNVDLEEKLAMMEKRTYVPRDQLAKDRRKRDKASIVGLRLFRPSPDTGKRCVTHPVAARRRPVCQMPVTGLCPTSSNT